MMGKVSIHIPYNNKKIAYCFSERNTVGKGKISCNKGSNDAGSISDRSKREREREREREKERKRGQGLLLTFCSKSFRIDIVT